MVLLEAQASGVPVVTSAVAGSEGLENEVTGFTFPEKDVNTLIRRVCDILGNNEPASRMAAAEPAYVREHFDIMRCTKRIEDLYDEILSATTRGARKVSTQRPNVGDSGAVSRQTTDVTNTAVPDNGGRSRCISCIF